MAVRAPEGKQGPIKVTLSTDLPQDLFLHWGVRRPNGRDWVAPPKVLLLSISMIMAEAVRFCECCGRPWSDQEVSDEQRQLGSTLKVHVKTFL